MSISGFMTTAATSVFYVFGIVHSLSVGTILYRPRNIVTTARISLVAKWRPGHRVVPPPNALKAVLYHSLFSEVGLS
jgi:hypothetical protein